MDVLFWLSLLGLWAAQGMRQCGAQAGRMAGQELSPTSAYLGHEAAEVARAMETWQRILSYEATHPVSLKVSLSASLKC